MILFFNLKNSEIKTLLKKSNYINYHKFKYLLSFSKTMNKILISLNVFSHPLLVSGFKIADIISLMLTSR
ncbi:conserved protein of unknown function [Oenococcus oeni]|uniref:Uncharacterized protein n=1 Tax=Oenococcus oeni TaxID=1247 RepID=A0AAQ2UUJ8_OENOE|nr:hypothetical protein ATW92_06565 [Oenococcus oeni]OIL13023.1 hypothetical protein ATW93_06660 [Oenococcus oeni]OIL37747.1 hypothetical protein ATX11_06565 [Oenococcus oeni]OLQ40036.1 hypothetical protein ATX28_06600 [Oenococcus oeni]SYW07606.1 conserved hypothetical protein [Oenococcus oeni]